MGLISEAKKGNAPEPVAVVVSEEGMPPEDILKELVEGLRTIPLKRRIICLF